MLKDIPQKTKVNIYAGKLLNPFESFKKVDPPNYDKIADTYDERYKSAYKPEGIASKLLELAKSIRAQRILEVGCGTGHWLKTLQDQMQVYGIMIVTGMDIELLQHYQPILQ